MYAELLLRCLSDVYHIPLPLFKIHRMYSGRICDGQFVSSGYIHDSTLCISIPVGSKLKTLKEDLEITVLHEFAHYINFYNLRSPDRRKLDSYNYRTNRKYAQEDEILTWLRTKDAAKLLGLWNKITLKMCIHSGPYAAVLKVFPE